MKKFLTKATKLGKVGKYTNENHVLRIWHFLKWIYKAYEVIGFIRFMMIIAVPILGVLAHFLLWLASFISALLNSGLSLFYFAQNRRCLNGF